MIDFKELMLSSQYDFLRTHERLGKRIILLKIGTGGFQKDDRTFSSEFYDILAHYESELERAIRETPLPDNPDMEKVGAFVEYVNRKAIEGDF